MISFNNSGSSCCQTSGVSKFQINSQGHLIVTYLDNTIEDLGLVVGANGTNGENFYPNEIGFEIPDGTFEQTQEIGWSYLSLANNTSKLYFKTSLPNVDPSTWNVVEFGKGDKGDTGAAGASFKIDSSGTTFPTDDLTDGYTFYNTSDGNLYFYDYDNVSWGTGVPFRGPRGTFYINSSGTTFPDVSSLDVGYTFYNTSDGKLYYIELNSLSQKVWSDGVEFKGEQGIQGIQGIQGVQGENIRTIYNTFGTEYPNNVLVVGECPAGYLITNIEVKVQEAYDMIDTKTMFVRFGGTASVESGGTVVASTDMFDIGTVDDYFVPGVNHEVSNSTEIVSCIFNDSVNNSTTGKITIYVTLTYQSGSVDIGSYI